MAADMKDPARLPRSVLVVEDDPVLAIGIETALLDAGIATVELTSTTDDALAALRRATPGAIVLDVHLADRDDGWAIAELVATLGADRPQIIFSTGSPHDIPEAIAAIGVVLEKPYPPADLIAALREPKARGLFSRIRQVLR